MLPELRKIVTYDEVILASHDGPERWAVCGLGCAAILSCQSLQNVDNDAFDYEVERIASSLGTILSDRLIELTGPTRQIEAYGKACITGTGLALETGTALAKAVSYDGLLPNGNSKRTYRGFSNQHGSEDTLINISLFSAADPKLPAILPTIQFTIHDAPAPDEVIIALGSATSGPVAALPADQTESASQSKRSLAKADRT